MAIELPVALEHPGRLLARLARQVELALAGVDLTLPQYRVLILLCERKEAASVLAEKLAVSRPSVTGVVDGLVARGLVRRQHDPEDRRRVGVVLTRHGRLLLASADRDVQRRLHEIASYTPAGTEAAFAGLTPWLDALEGHRDARRAAAAGLAAETAAAGAAR
jgi:long-chain acyl-CoA synthetase